MEETIQKNLNQNREMIERIPLKDKKNWKEDFDERFSLKQNNLNGELAYEEWKFCDPRQVKEYIESLLAEQKKELMKEERQFIINVLDGIDIADKQMGVIGGTQAIRQALKNRVI